MARSKHGINNLGATNVEQPKKAKQKADHPEPKRLRSQCSLNMNGPTLHGPIEDAGTHGYPNLCESPRSNCAERAANDDAKCSTALRRYLQRRASLHVTRIRSVTLWPPLQSPPYSRALRLPSSTYYGQNNARLFKLARVMRSYEDEIGRSATLEELTFHL
jgi:hypothetical protein